MLAGQYVHYVPRRTSHHHHAEQGFIVKMESSTIE